MVKTIFRNILLVGVLVLIICGLLFFAMQYTGAKNDMRSTLQEEAVYVEQGLAQNGPAFFEGLDLNTRISLVDESGRIVYYKTLANDKEPEGQNAPDDQTIADATELDKPEVEQAFREGTGYAVRKSPIDNKNAMYYAVLCEDGTVLRVSKPMSSMWDAFLRVSPVLWVLVIVLIISAVLAFRASRKIVRPINELDLDHPDVESYPELQPLIEKIQEQKLTIQDETAQREQMRREFTANISHELKTPVTTISGFAELMAQGIVPPDKVQEYSRDIYKESNRLISLIDDIIALSKLDEEAVGPTQEDIDLKQLAADVVDSLRQTAEQKDVSMELTGDEAHISGISQLLSEMIYNLCDNAIKYNEPGGKVTVNIKADENETRLSVEDTGIGIPEEYQQRVFERFFRVDKSNSSNIDGTGLGLSIVKHGARFHNAGVELESTPGEGTKITLVFPAKEKQEKA